jgi:hypothetical protein
MKNLLKFLPVVMIALTFASCGEKQDWVCECTNLTSLTITETPILDSTEKAAAKECDEGDTRLLGVLVDDCELQ